MTFYNHDRTVPFLKRLSGSVLPSSRSTLKPSNQVGVHFILNTFKDCIMSLGNFRQCLLTFYNQEIPSNVEASSPLQL